MPDSRRCRSDDSTRIFVPDFLTIRENVGTAVRFSNSRNSLGIEVDLVGLSVLIDMRRVSFDRGQDQLDIRTSYCENVAVIICQVSPLLFDFLYLAPKGHQPKYSRLNRAQLRR
jgi:hypothetical protein